FTARTQSKTRSKSAQLVHAEKLDEAAEKTYGRVGNVEEKARLTADAVLTGRAALSDLLMKDLEAVETRLGRDPSESEKAVLQKLADALLSEKPVSAVGLTADELKAISARNFYSNKPVIVAEEAELTAPDALMVRAF